MATIEIRKKIKGFSKLIYRAVLFGIVSLFSIALTAFVFLNSFELIFNQDIAYVDSVNKTNLSPQLDYIVKQSVDHSYYYTSNNFLKTKKLEYIEIPIIKRKLEVSRALNKDEDWYVKGNKSNYFLTVNSNRSENLIIYAEKSWRTIPDTKALKVGDLIYMTTDDNWNYVFRIESINSLKSSERFVLQSSSEIGLSILLDDSTKDGYSLIQAELINSRAS